MAASYYKTRHDALYLDPFEKNNKLTVIIYRFGQNPTVFIDLPFTDIEFTAFQTDFTRVIKDFNNEESEDNKNKLIDELVIINAILRKIFDYIDTVSNGSKTIINLSGVQGYTHISKSTGTPPKGVGCRFEHINSEKQKLLFIQQTWKNTKGNLLISTTIPGGVQLEETGENQLSIVTPLGLINLNVFMKSRGVVYDQNWGNKLSGTTVPFNFNGFGPRTDLNPTTVL
jgi:hypothetical protein